MPTITDWLMVAITGVYVIATVLICVFNAKSAKATKEQTIEMRKQYLENTRARVIARVEFVVGAAVLIFENVGQNAANNVQIDINPEWVALYNRTKQLRDNDTRLNELRQKRVFLPSQSKIVYPIFYVCDGSGDVSVLSEKPIIIKIDYNDHYGNYSETTSIDLSGYTGVIDYDAYSKLKNKEIEELKKVSKELQVIGKAMNKQASGHKNALQEV